MIEQRRKREEINAKIITEISGAVNELRYGTVTITVHDRRITQFEVTHKNRFDSKWLEEWLVEKGGGI